MKTILSFLLILVALFTFGQGPKPEGTLKLIPSPGIYKRPADSTLHLYQGPVFGWDRLITGRDSASFGGGGGGDNYGYWKLANNTETGTFKINYGYLYNRYALSDTLVTKSAYNGYLYNWYTLSDGASPINAANAHVPTSSEWWDLWYYLNSVDPGNEGGALKETGFAYWNGPNTGATNSVGFNAYGSGFKDTGGAFWLFNEVTMYWAADSSSPTNAFCFFLQNTNGLFQNDNNAFEYGLSVRLIVDSPVEISGDNAIYIGNDGQRYTCKLLPYGGGGAGTWWLTQNLIESKYQDGNAIPEVSDYTEWAALTTGARSSYDNVAANAYSTSNSVKSIANNNAHVPTIEEFGYMRDYLTSIDPDNEAGMLKEAGLSHWNDPSNGTDNYGFAMLGAGSRGDGGGGVFGNLKDFSGLWTITASDVPNQGWGVAFRNYQSSWESWTDVNTDGFSVRLIVDTPNTLSEDGLTGTYIGNDGTVYKVVSIGETYWLAESLVETQWSDHTTIPNVTDDTAWGALTTAARCSYDNDPTLALSALTTGSDLLVHAKNTIDFKNTSSVTWTKTALTDSTIQIEANATGGGGGGISASGSAKYLPRWNDTGDSLVVSPFYVTGIDTALISTSKNGGSYGDNLLFGQEDITHRRDTTFTGSSNTLMGSRVAPWLSSGNGNTLIGNVSGYYLGQGSYNTALGMQAGAYMEDDAKRNIMIGVLSGTYSTNDSDMIFIGNNSFNDYGGNIHNSIAIGNRAYVGMSDQVVIGNDSTKYTVLRGEVTIPQLRITSPGDGYNKILISNGSGLMSFTDLPEGSGSVASVAIVSANGISGTVDSPTLNPAITLSLGAITPTSVNGVGISSIGTNSIWLGGGGSSSTGSSNTAIGYQAGFASTTAIQNTFIGNQAGANITTGGVNVAIGHDALNGGSASTSWANNAIGYNSISSITTGASNCAFGYYSLGGLTTGSRNIAIGFQAGLFLPGYSSTNETSESSIFIGSDTYPSGSGNYNEIVIGEAAIGHGTNTVTLGNSSIDSSFVHGTIYGIKYPYVAKTTAYTATERDYVINCTGFGPYTITLPSAVGIQGKVYIIKNSITYTITIGTTSGQSIDGTTGTSLPTQWSKITVMSNGANWITL